MKSSCRWHVTALTFSRFLLALVFLGAVMGAHAGVVLSPTGIVANDYGANPFGSYPEANMINQSNVTAFTSGVTDFATYVAGNPVGGCNNCSGHYFGNPVYPGNIDFDLGTEYLVNQLGLFNGSYRGATSIQMYTSSLADFSSATFVGAYSPTLNGNASVDEPIQVFNLTDTNARYVRMSILSSGDPDNCCVGISEVTFEVGPSSQVPEPVTLALLGIGLAGLQFSRRKKV